MPLFVTPSSGVPASAPGFAYNAANCQKLVANTTILVVLAGTFTTIGKKLPFAGILIVTLVSRFWAVTLKLTLLVPSMVPWKLFSLGIANQNCLSIWAFDVLKLRIISKVRSIRFILIGFISFDRMVYDTIKQNVLIAFRII